MSLKKKEKKSVFVCGGGGGEFYAFPCNLLENAIMLNTGAVGFGMLL